MVGVTNLEQHEAPWSEAGGLHSLCAKWSFKPLISIPSQVLRQQRVILQTQNASFCTNKIVFDKAKIQRANIWSQQGQPALIQIKEGWGHVDYIQLATKYKTKKGASILVLSILFSLSYSVFNFNYWKWIEKRKTKYHGYIFGSDYPGF